MSFNLKLAIVAILAVHSAMGYFSIPLQQLEVKGANGVAEDWIYYFQGTYGELQYHVNTIVDTTTQFNWVSSADCTNCPAAPEGSDSYQCKDPTCVKSETAFSSSPLVAGKRIQLNGNTEATERLQVAGETFQHLAVILPGSLQNNSGSELLSQGLRAGLGLGPKRYVVKEGALPLPKQEKDQKRSAVNQNFADEVYWAELSAKNGFSFVFSENVNQVIIGERENFFASGDARVFQISEKETSWALPLKEIQLNDVAKVPLSTAQRVRFDSTTRYIVGNAAVIKEITDAIVEFGESCTKSKEKGIYQCYCNKESDRKRFPSLNFKFGGQSDEEAYFTVQNEDYIDFDAGAQSCQLLLKEKTNFGVDDNIIELGTVFLASYYTYFDQAARTISLAPATGVSAEGLYQDSLTRILIIVFGILLAILAVLGLLLILKGVRVPEKPPVVQRTYSPVKVQYVQTIPVQTVSPIQSQYVHQNLSQPPTGFIQFSTLPQHYSHQPQQFIQSQQVFKSGNNQL